MNVLPHDANIFWVRGAWGQTSLIRTNEWHLLSSHK